MRCVGGGRCRSGEGREPMTMMTIPAVAAGLGVRTVQIGRRMEMMTTMTVAVPTCPPASGPAVTMMTTTLSRGVPTVFAVAKIVR